MTTRVYPPRGAANTMIVNGRSYTCAAGQSINVPDHDAAVLQTNGWIVSTMHGSGATTTRPTTGLYVGLPFLDETLGYTIKWNGVAWINPMNGNVV